MRTKKYLHEDNLMDKVIFRSFFINLKRTTLKKLILY